MIIGIDGNEANVEGGVGINTYSQEVLRHLHKLQDDNKCTHSFVIYLKETPTNKLPRSRKGWQYKVLKGKGYWIIKVLMPYLWRNPDKIDVFFTPSHYIPPFVRLPRVCSIMDLGYLVFTGQFKRKDYWQLRLWSAYSIKISKYILSISKATTSDIQKYYPNASKKIKTVYLAYDKSDFNAQVPKNRISSIKKKYGIPDNYILFLSTLKPSKNIEGLLKAWSMIEHLHPDYRLVITGKKGWLFDSIFQLVEKLQLSDRVIFTGYIPDEDKAPLTAGAKAFVLPSFWEGFGLDVLNSYACGVPAVLSDRGSLKEVGGEPGIYVNPDNPDDISKGIEKVITMDQKRYNTLVKSCIAHAKKFSWEKTAKETLVVLELAGK